jgi:putative Mg2+ transporter-C (MgtC) family protein
MTGIGFIGGGAILKDQGSVKGTATAASIWNTGAVGAGVAFDRYEIAILLSLLNFLILLIMTPIKGKLRHS